MSEIETSEHCFNLADAEHVEGTSRFIFSYPEIWYTNQTIKDMSLGIRSIILKPEPVFVNFQDLYVKGDNTSLETEIAKLSIPVINNQKVLPNQMLIDMRKNVDERVDILSFVNWANEKIINDLEYHMDICDSAYGNVKYVDLSRYSVYFQYEDDGSLLLSCNAHSNFCFKALRAKICSDNPINAFNSGFHKLVGLDYTKPDTNINTYIADLFVILYTGFNDENIKKARIQAVLDKAKENGIEIIYDINKTELEDDVFTEAITNQTIHVGANLLINGFRFHNVWSRKDVMLRSSICEMDKRGYLGFSSNYSNSAQAIYAQPKMYDVNNQNSKFWVELFDSYTQKAINILDGNMLLIEAVVCQKPKRTFNRT